MKKRQIISSWACVSGSCSWIQSQAGSCPVLFCPVLGPCWLGFLGQWVTGTVSHLAKAQLAEQSGCLADSQPLPSHCAHSLSSETNLWKACLGYLSPLWILGFLYLKYLWWSDAICLFHSFPTLICVCNWGLKPAAHNLAEHRFSTIILRPVHTAGGSLHLSTTASLSRFIVISQIKVDFPSMALTKPGNRFIHSVRILPSTHWDLGDRRTGGPSWEKSPPL